MFPAKCRNNINGNIQSVLHVHKECTVKKKIIVIANGWYNRGVCDIMKGIKRYTEGRGIDIFLFLTYSQFRESNEYNEGEFNIHRLPIYKDYDGVIFIPDSLSSPREAERLRKLFVENKIPAVSVGTPMHDVGYVSCNNYESMSIMCEHLATKHDIKRVAFIAGHKDNAESNLRLAGCRDTFARHGVNIENRDIFYCNWEYSAVVKAAKKLATDKKGLPDVVVCANDVGAMAVCSTFEDMGYSVPDDVRVTGYDNVWLTRAFSPSITTMAQPYEDMGYGSAELLYSMIETGAIGERNYNSKLVIGESCGCKADKHAAQARKNLARENFLDSEKNILYERVNVDIENAMFRTNSYEDLPVTLQEHFASEHGYEGNGFSIVLEHAYAQNIYSKHVDLKSTGFGKSMTVPVAVDKGGVFGLEDFESSSLIPGYRRGRKTHIYVISSLHSRNNIFGYVVMRDAMQHVEDRSLYPYMSRLGESFEKYRKIMRLDHVNTKLQELSVKDALTGLYNRLGYENFVVPKYADDRAQNLSNAIIFIDINRLKYINDTFGHLQGDMAIRTIATVISECMPKEWMAVRYGGDEYLIIGPVIEGTDVQYLCERICSTVGKRGEEMRLPYRLSASYGYLTTDPTSDTTLEEYIETVDRYMYENKKRTYEKENTVQ